MKQLYIEATIGGKCNLQYGPLVLYQNALYPSSQTIFYNDWLLNWMSHDAFEGFSLNLFYTVKGFSIINEAEVDAFLEFPCFLYDPTDVSNLISGSPAFSKSSLYIWKFPFHVLLKPSLKDFEHTLAIYFCFIDYTKAFDCDRKWKCYLLSRIWLFETPWTVARHAPLSMEMSRQEYWSRFPCPPPGALPNTGTEPGSPALQADTLLYEPWEKPDGSQQAMENS